MKFGFLVAGRDDDGLGHVSRSLGLALSLASMGHSVKVAGPLSKLALQKVISAGVLCSRSPSWDVDAVVIDAIELGDEFIPWMVGPQKKVLISPRFMQPGLVDFIFSRVKTPTVNAVVRSGGEAFVDPMYAFSGMSMVGRVTPPAEKARTIGICISGAESYVDLNAVIHGVAAVDSVAQVVIVGDERCEYADIRRINIRQIAKTTDLWAAFGLIDLLITGDGVTMFEGMARGIPTLSIGREGAIEKNRVFYDQNWCAFLSASNLKSNAISKVVSDLGWAGRTHHSLMGKDIRSFGNLMATQIEEVVRHANGVK